MALDATRMGQAIAATIESFKPADGTEITLSQLEQMWIQVSQDIIDEFSANGDIALEQADIPILPGTFVDGNGNPITGQGINDTATVSGRIE